MTNTSRDRIEHIPFGDPCMKCGQPESAHRERRPRVEYFRNYNHMRPERRDSSIKRKKKRGKLQIVAIDGEGYEQGSIYAYIAAWSERQEKGHLERLNGIRTHELLDFLLALPTESTKVGFSLGYDYTHWLKDIPNESLYRLNHPEMRIEEKGSPGPVSWVYQGILYHLNMLSGRFSVGLVKMGQHKPGCFGLPTCAGCKYARKTVVWDFFKFFQTSFVKACKEWQVISEKELEFVQAMKNKRPDFKRPTSRKDKDWEEVKRYCGIECQRMAALANKVIDAHNAAGLKLRTYYGAGSTSGALLDKMGARDYCRIKVEKGYRQLEPYHPALRHALARAFFGGRFEISRRGPVRRKVWSKDISSAYPYAFTFLPCLVHGEWEWHSKVSTFQIEQSDMAVVQYSLPWVQSIGKIVEGASEVPWGPFPFRNLEGNIIFPVTSGGGWIHKNEYLAGLRHFPNVRNHGAWLYKTACSCEVFRHKMPEYYKLRLSWGKEGKGQVMKLGMNGGYGKTAQTKGHMPPFQCIPWAGDITSNCRAQVIPGLSEHCLMVATDGIVLTQDIEMAPPRDTGTFDVKKPLGGWETNEFPGLFMIRPGIAFPLDSEVVEKETKARGIGKTVLTRMREQVLREWEQDGPGKFEVTRPMFWGMKSQIYKAGNDYRRGKLYGHFSDQVVSVDYHPHPKRPCVTDDNTLMTWALGDNEFSQAYKPFTKELEVVSEHVKFLREEKLLALDQPDYNDWEEEEL